LVHRWAHSCAYLPAILGVILLLTGAQVALGACDIPKDKGERFALIVASGLVSFGTSAPLWSAWRPIGSTRRVGFASRPKRHHPIAGQRTSPTTRSARVTRRLSTSQVAL